MKSTIKFADKKLKKAFDKLKGSKTEDKQLWKWIDKAMDFLEEDAFCGIRIPKKTHTKRIF